MTETTTFPPEPPPPPPPSDPPPPSGPPPSGGVPPAAPRLVRDPEDAVVAGVCAAVARHTGTDPVLWRVTIAVLTLFGGAGLVLYVLGWLLVPRRGERQSVLERVVRRPDRRLSVAGVVLAVIGGVVLLAVADDGPALGVLLVLGVLAYLVLRERREPRPTTWAPDHSTAYAPTYAPTYGPNYGPNYGPTYGPSPDPSPGPVPDLASYGHPSTGQAPPARPPRSRLGALTLSVAALLTGLLLALRLAGVDGLTAPRIVAAALLVVGGGLLAGTWVGRARWLLAVGAVLALLLGATAAAERADLPAGVGERTWTPVGSGTHRLGAGEAVLDLRALPSGRPVELDAQVGLGALTVLVPADVTVGVEAEVGVGAVFQTDEDGRRTELGDGDDTGLREVFVVGDRSGDVRARLDLEVGMGQIEVRRVAA